MSEERNAPALFPRPQRLVPRGGYCSLPAQVRLGAPQDLTASPALGWLAEALAASGRTLFPAGEGGAALHVELVFEPPSRPSATDESYRLAIGPSSIRIGAAASAGLQHGVSTLVQLVRLAQFARLSGPPESNVGRDRLELPCLDIEDHPDIVARGVMLDISRDKVPTPETLRALVDQLALWKINQLQLYMEHTFAYAGHERVWGQASPLDAREVRELDAYCAARHIELVPNQNSFGHMHRWLRHDPYRALAECPEGFEHPWNWTGEPYGLCATDPASVDFLASLYDELLPCFGSRQINVGMDETLDLGSGRSRAACEALGEGRVYLQFLKQVHALLNERGRVMQFWGDIIVKRPDLVPELPRGAIALTWGYEADHPFARDLQMFASAGLSFYVCPGTSSWNSIAGRTDNTLANIALAVREGHAAGAAGVLTTDWGDHGHLQPLSVSYLGLLVGAGLSWNVADAAEPSTLDVPALLDRHVFFDPACRLGRAAFDLGNTYRFAGSLRPNASVLFWALLRPDRLFSPPGVTAESLERTLQHLDAAGAELALARPLARDGALVVAELGWARDLLRFACRLGLARCAGGAVLDVGAVPASARAPLAHELGELCERHRALWLQRNRPGGLVDSVARLERLLETLRGSSLAPSSAPSSQG
jgi:hexosaminidase